jgi:hypothetical protein
LFSINVLENLEEKCMANDEQFGRPSIETPSVVPVDGWKPNRLPELASNGLPFSPTFILPTGASCIASPTSPAEISLPFGFHYRRPHAISNRPVLDLTRGYYDPYTQVYTIPLQAGGDTDGGTISTGNWTEKGDGAAPTKEWDITDDRVTD